MSALENIDSACTGKVRFEDFSMADKAANRKTKRRPAVAKPYKCEHCNGWHLGAHIAGTHLDTRFKRQKQGARA